MHSLGIHHVAVRAGQAGVAAVADFYCQVAHLPELSRHFNADGSLRSVWLSLASSGDPQAGFLAVEQGDHFGPAIIALKILVTDRGALLALLQARNIQPVKQTRWTLYVEDPAGNQLAFSHHPHDPLT